MKRETNSGEMKRRQPRVEEFWENSGKNSEK